MQPDDLPGVVHLLLAACDRVHLENPTSCAHWQTNWRLAWISAGLGISNRLLLLRLRNLR